MIIDGHLHYSSRYLSTENLITSLDRAGVGKAFLVPYAYEKSIYNHLPNLPLWTTQLPYAEHFTARLLRSKIAQKRQHELPPNHEIREAIQRFPEHFEGCYWANPLHPACHREATEYITKYRFKGIKLHQVLHPCSLKDGRVQALLHLADRHRLPVFIHLSSSEEMKNTVEAARQFPNISFIIGHLGIETFWKVAEKERNIFFDVSPVYSHSPATLMRAAVTLGSERLIFGADIPFPDVHEDGITKIEHLPLSREDKASILGDNLNVLLRRVLH